MTARKKKYARVAKALGPKLFHLLRHPSAININLGRWTLCGLDRLADGEKFVWSSGFAWVNDPPELNPPKCLICLEKAPPEFK